MQNADKAANLAEELAEKIGKKYVPKKKPVKKDDDDDLFAQEEKGKGDQAIPNKKNEQEAKELEKQQNKDLKNLAIRKKEENWQYPIGEGVKSEYQKSQEEKEDNWFKLQLQEKKVNAEDRAAEKKTAFEEMAERQKKALQDQLAKQHQPKENKALAQITNDKVEEIKE